LYMKNMNFMKERTKLLVIICPFLSAYYIPWGNATVRQSGLEAFMMLQEHAREHVLTWRLHPTD
jgi:hypothetical protein